jgi:hypothetical protein
MGSTTKKVDEGSSLLEEMDVILVDRELLRRKDISLLAKLVWTMSGVLSCENPEDQDFTWGQMAEALGVTEDGCIQAWRELQSHHQKKANREWWERLSLKHDAKEHFLEIGAKLTRRDRFL